MVRAPYPFATWMVAVPTPPAAPCTRTVSPVLQVPALGQRELGGEVVHRDRRALLEGERVGQREDAVRTEADDVGGAAVAQAGCDPVTLGEPGALRRGTYDAREVDPERERELGLELVLALAEQQVGEADPDRVDIDKHLRAERAVDARFGNLLDRDSGRTLELRDPDCAHGTRLEGA